MTGLADRLKATREQRGLNLTQVAKELGVARTAYRLWELGAAVPSHEHWGKVAMWCEIPLATILRDVGVIDADEEQALMQLAVDRQQRRPRKR